MARIEIKEVLRVYHLPGTQQQLKEDIDRKTEIFLRQHLPQCLERKGGHASDIICLNELKLKLPFDDGLTDIQCYQRWLGLLEDYLDQMQFNPESSGYLRYANWPAAMLAIGRDLSRSDTRRAWAWRMMGVVQGEDNSTKTLLRQWIDYLSTHPQLMLPTIPALIESGILYQIMQQRYLGVPGLSGLTEVALRYLSIPLSLLDFPVLTEGYDMEKYPGLGGNLTPQVKQFCELLLTLSVEASGVENFAGYIKQASTEDKQQLLQACVWPCLLRLSGQTNRGFLSKQSVVQALQLAAHALHMAAYESQMESRSPAGNIQTDTENTLLPAHLQKCPTSWQNNNQQGRTSQDNEQNPQHTDMVGYYGGLVFLLNLFEAAGVIDALHQEVFSPCPLPLLLQQFCLVLQPQAEGDIAVEVVSGSLFSKLQADQCNELTPSQKACLDALAREFKLQVNGLLQEQDEKGKRDVDHFSQMCLRKIRVEAESGWVNVFYQYDSIETSIRRSGLDLDPGFVPWLGYVVKIYYE